jgi:FkbM family methyltransferase
MTPPTFVHVTPPAETLAGQPRLTPYEVRQAYRLLFDRPPESAEVIEQHASAHADVWSLLRSLMESAEFRGRAADFSPPRTTLDGQALRARFEQPQAPLRAGYLTDFLGLHTRVDFLGPNAPSEGRIDSLPVAGDAHCSPAEWIAGLRGVELAGEDFVCVELGAGWGAWMAILSRAARLLGAKRTFAIGCEADEQHCRMLREHLATNGLSPRDYRLFEGAVGPRRGVAIFPQCEDSRDDWGLRPVFCRNEREAEAFVTDPQSHADYRGFQFKCFQRVACFTLADLLEGIKQVDVMHIDIQGGEFELIEQNLELLQHRVGYLAVGTHSRTIEGRLMAALSAADWVLEVEEPCSFDITQPGFPPQVDGVQGWRNKRLRP